MDVNAFIAKAKQGAVTVEFTKINTGEVRVMPCTLNPTLLEAAGINVTVENVDLAILEPLTGRAALCFLVALHMYTFLHPSTVLSSARSHTSRV